MICYHCFFLAAGLSFAFPYEDLTKNTGATQAHTFPGDIKLYGANNAIDGNKTTCTRTRPIGQGTSFPDKTVWWKVDLREVYNIYSINILFRNYAGEESRQIGRFAGFSLYVSTTDVPTIEDIRKSILCNKDGPKLPPLNFTTICPVNGRYVIFYNERLDTVTYPNEFEIHNGFAELCEVTVKGCTRLDVYGIRCDRQCPLNCNKTCHIQSGACSECKHGFYGDYCNNSCHTTCKNNACHMQSGACFECENGVFGNNCNSLCPNNCKDNACHILNGSCFGCTSGWTGVICNDKCKDGWYGINCSQPCSGHCKDNIACNHVTGQCDGGCDAGWTRSLCNEVCDDGTYGYNCTYNCSSNCLDGSICNKQNGNCEQGCKPGYINSDCHTKCSSGYFGIGCRDSCTGHCINNEPCDHISGVCSTGCKDGYVGTHCNNSCTSGTYGNNCAFQCPINCNKTCEHIHGLCKFEDEVTGTTSFYTSTSSTNLSATVGGIVGTCVILIIGVIMAMSFLRFKRKASRINKRESIVLEAKQHTAIVASKVVDHKTHSDYANDSVESTYSLPEKTKRGPPTNKNISVRNINAQIGNMSANENTGFKSEYHDIPRGELHPCTEAKNPVNKAKNRYTTIFPYDHSRIILKPLASGGSDYINANYIEDTRGRRLYIATQGPKPKTIADFWTMIWQEEVCNIVCLTNLTEGTKNKCAQYWPDINDKLQGGTLTIRHLEEKTYADYIIRQFKIHNKTTRSDRHMTMFHYTTWSDHGVADPLSLVVFHRHVIRATANSAGKYTVVHCSAGVGRTGTYIALDALYREGERTGKINVPMYVRTMRKDRMNMIQGDDQYKLLYLALKDAFYGQNKCLETEKFLGEYQEQTCYTNCGDVAQKKSLSSDLEELLSLRKEYTQQDYISGRAQISANYTESVLPVEEFMCHLYYMKGYNTYYNAVLIQSYLEKDSLISAQYPLPDNTEDFLRLVKDFDARVVVFLCPLEDIESTSKWFPPENQHKFNGIFYVKNMSSTRSQNVKMTRLNIQPTGFNEMDITLLECPTWGEKQKRGDKRVLLDVIKAVKTEKSDQKGRVLVLSRDGATRCGAFFVVYNVLEQISVDREVDIFTAVRQVQIRRPECVSTVDEYKLCHDAVAEYLLNDCVYGNC